MKRIDSRANPAVRLYRSLSGREGRAAAGFMAAEGIRLVLEAVRSPLPLEEVFLSDGLDEAAAAAVMRALEERAGPKPAGRIVAEPVFRSMAHTMNPQGVAALVGRPPATTAVEAAAWDRVVILCRPQDPGNLGSIIRSAEAAGLPGLAVVEPACDPFGPKAVRASMGSIFRLPVARCRSLDEIAEALAGRGHRLLAADPRAARSVYGVDLSPPVAVVFGSEAAGLPSLGERAAVLFALPMRGRAESLNLAQAATAVFFEMLRRDLEKQATPGR